MFVNWSEWNMQFWERTFHRYFLPSFSSFGWAVSEENIKMWKVNGRQATDGGHQAMGKVYIAFLQRELKRTNNDLHIITKKTKGLAARAPL